LGSCPQPQSNPQLSLPQGAAGVEERKITNVNRHKNLPDLRRYIRNATAFDDVGEVL